FTAGRLRNNLELSEVRKDIAVAQYEKSIQTAFKEVADSLAGEATYGAQLQALRDQQKSAYESLNLSDLRYRNGIDSFLQVQTAQINLFTVQQSFVQVGLESLLNKVELYKALGGGWNRDTTMRPNPDAPLTNTVPVSGNATQITPSTQP
ncbi:MAG: TolC family protein, partial [Advenella sp.]